MDICFLFPRRVDSAVAGLEEAKNPAGKDPPLDSDPRSDREFGEILPPSQAKSVQTSPPRNLDATRLSLQSHDSGG